MRFAFTGDTRPDQCDDFANYPTGAMDAIASGMATKHLAFALDTGDHMKVCKNTDAATAQASAQQQLDLYKASTDKALVPFYYVMGNHECLDNKSLCDTSDVSLGVFMNYLVGKPPQPYRWFDVPTPHGRATFVLVADTAWSADEAAWLEATLQHGDASAYTIVAKHVPSDSGDFSNGEEMAIIDRHKFALLVDAHTHQYLNTNEGGREFTLGLGGAPVVNSGDDFAYGVVEQQADGRLQVTIYNASTDLPRDTKTVGPN